MIDRSAGGESITCPNDIAKNFLSRLVRSRFFFLQSLWQSDKPGRQEGGRHQLPTKCQVILENIGSNRIYQMNKATDENKQDGGPSVFRLGTTLSGSQGAEDRFVDPAQRPEGGQ